MVEMEGKRRVSFERTEKRIFQGRLSYQVKKCPKMASGPHRNHGILNASPQPCRIYANRLPNKSRLHSLQNAPVYKNRKEL